MFSFSGGQGLEMDSLGFFLWPPTSRLGLIYATLSYLNGFRLVLFFPLVFWTKTKFPQTLIIEETYKQNLFAYPDWFSGVTQM